MDSQESLSYLDELAAFGMKPGLQRIRRLLELLDQPQERYRSIHVTGTNGKGSVSSMLARILRSSDIHVGLFTSPHLVSYTERIQIDGQPISESDFASCLSVVRVY
ncbi:MAG: bifunctional folylpolyglutamate synthase/dihydrofolate synthase, partial [Selenomonadaceae bacterium]|nr:bifunctional folylpolyglutamate synthase/dihydrofolate synthase [Selenomonadaceae bacterium]